MAKEEGFFARRGLDVELTLIANNATLPPALISNSKVMSEQQHKRPQVIISASLAIGS